MRSLLGVLLEHQAAVRGEQQFEARDAIGVSAGGFFAWKRGDVLPSARWWKRLGEYLGFVDHMQLRKECLRAKGKLWPAGTDPEEAFASLDRMSQDEFAEVRR